MDVDTPPESKLAQRRFSRRQFTVLVAVGCVIALMFVVYVPLLRWWKRSHGEHLTFAEVNGRVRLNLPPVASDIRFYQHLHPDQVIVVDFAISKDDFLEWAARQGWKPEPVVGGITIWPRSDFGDRAAVITVTNGYGYHTLRRGEPNCFSVTYDRGTQRAYYEYCSEPHGEE